VLRLTGTGKRTTGHLAFNYMNAKRDAAAPRVLLADADAPTRAGLRVALTSDGFDVVAEASDGESAVTSALELEPDAALLAASLPGDGIAAARDIAAQRPRVRLVVVSDDPSGEELLEAVMAGASGYLGRDVSPERLPTALRGVLAGEVALPRRHTQHLLEALRGRTARRAMLEARASSAITDREWEVLELMSSGASTAEIAHRLRISAVTVRRHSSSVLAKLDVPDRTSVLALLDRARE
jgi:DNA-binding NarL/FixJ family response regulator